MVLSRTSEICKIVRTILMRKVCVNRKDMKRSKFYYLMHPSVGIPALLAKVSDRYAIEQMWKGRMSYPLDLDNPRTFSEKLQWLKLHNRKPLYTKLVDKYVVKDIVGNMIGHEYIIPTLGVYKHFDEIDFDTLPNQFVLKCNHDSGSVKLIRNKDALTDEDILEIRDYYNSYGFTGCIISTRKKEK